MLISPVVLPGPRPGRHQRSVRPVLQDLLGGLARSGDPRHCPPADGQDKGREELRMDKKLKQMFENLKKLMVKKPANV